MKVVESPKVIKVAKKLTTNFKHHGSLSELFHKCVNYKEKKIIFDFTQSVVFDDCMAICIYYIFELLLERGVRIECKLKESTIKVNQLGDIWPLLDWWDNLIGLYIVDVDKPEQIELFQTELSSLKVGVSRRIKVAINEILANVSMHSDIKKCYIGISSLNGYLKIVLFNPGKKISESVKALGYEFEKEYEDLSSIVWASKKGHSSRNIGIPGGLGLFIARKNVVEEKGEITITSGTGCVMDQWEFYKNWEDDIIPNKEILPYEIRGTLVAISIPQNDIEEEKTCNMENISIGELIWE